MAEKAQQIMQDGVKDLIETIDKDHLRRIQGKMHRCAADCCDRSDYTLEQVHNCISQCSDEISKAQKFMSSELANFQNRLERCAMSCQDQIRDKMGSNPKQSDMEMYKNQYEDCVVKCAETNIKLLPNMLKRMKDVISSGSYTMNI